MADRLHVVISGRVQGVGFRYSIEREAQRLGLRGWARNLPAGNVEAEFEGPRDALDPMLAWCRRGPATARVTGVAEQWDAGPPQYNAFEIRF